MWQREVRVKSAVATGCKPDSVPADKRRMTTIHLSDRNPRLIPPKREWYGPHHRLLFGLAPEGVCPAPLISRRAVGSYPTISPLSRTQTVPLKSLKREHLSKARKASEPFRCGTVYFLWHFPSRGVWSAVSCFSAGLPALWSPDFPLLPLRTNGAQYSGAAVPRRQLHKY